MVLKFSSALGHKATQTLYYAIEQAERINLPLNAYTTLNFALTTIPAHSAVQAFGKLRANYYNKWARRPRRGQRPAYEPTYAYVFENTIDGKACTALEPDGSHNVHVHWLVHVPAKRRHDFDGLVYGWLDRVADELSPANAVKITNITNPLGLRRYTLKGSNEIWAPRYGAAHTPQGVIVGRRSGVSRNLGPTARIRLDRMLNIRRAVA
jgi:hypothetical protein